MTLPRLCPALLLAASTGLAACSTPYGNRIAPDLAAPQAPATILVSDPKLYRREALIDERREEVAYINRLMKESETIAFTPDIVRELEVIRSLSLSLGVGSDPAAGRANRQAERVGEIRDEIELTKLQLELAQMKRDAELARDRLPAQTEPTAGATGGSGTAPATRPVTAADASAVITRIDALQKSLADRLAASVPGPRGVTATANPIDSFRDRATYRALLATARNAASLDELHDSGGNALARFTFQATILPDRQGKHDAAVGLLKMSVDTAADNSLLPEIYQGWISHLNAAGDISDPDILKLAREHELFTLAFLERPKPGTKLAAAAPACSKLVAAPTGQCDHLHIFTPMMRDPVTGLPVDFTEVGELVNSGFLGSAMADSLNAISNLDSRQIAALNTPGSCALDAEDHLVPAPQDLRAMGEQAGAAQQRIAAIQSISQEDRAKIGMNARVADFGVSLLTSIVDALVRNGADLATQQRWANQTGAIIAYKAALGARVRCLGPLAAAQPEVPPAFAERLARVEKRLTVYDVSPREQVQLVSTAARAADAISLAAALSAQAPSSGAAATAAAGFSRSASGKADQIERNPVIVGFAQAARGTGTDSAASFGWVLGPRVNINARRQRLELRQTPRVHDLSADISYPGWLPRLRLRVESALAPAWSGLNLLDQQPGARAEQAVTIKTQPTAADYDALTQLLAGTGNIRRPTLKTIAPTRLRACEAATLRIEGRHLWRATAVQIGALKLEGDAIRVLPDLSGIMVAVPRGIALADKAELAVLTPYDVVVPPGDVAFRVEGAASCAAPDAPEPDAPKPPARN